MSEENSQVDRSTIPAVLRHWATTCPDQEAFVFFNETGRTTALTAGEVYTLAGKFATRLRQMGFLPGDLVANAVPNSPERVVTDFGVSLAGCIVSNCQIMEKDGSDFWRVAHMCNTKGVILPTHQQNAEYTVLKQFLPSPRPASWCVDVTIPDAPSIKHVIMVDRQGQNEDTTGSHPPFLDSLRHSDEEVYHPQHVSPTSTFYVFSTSGTTGFSKMSPRSHQLIMRTASAFEKAPRSIRFSCRPLGWVGGFPHSFLANCTCTVAQDYFEGKDSLDVKSMWKIILQENCTSASLLPQEVNRFLAEFKDNPPECRLKMVITGGLPMSRTIGEAVGVFTDAFLVTYASTEMAAVTGALIFKPDQMEDFLAGHPLPGVSVRIVDEKMEDVNPGDKGIILVKSPMGSNHYYNYDPPKPTCTDDGYFITGDRGWMKNGALYVSDRNDDVIHHGAILVYPSWPESVLAKIPGVAEVAVMGVPDPGSHGEKLLACVVTEPGLDLTQEDIITSYNALFSAINDEYYPQLSEVKLFESFPKNRNEKIAKKKLKEIVLNMIQ